MLPLSLTFLLLAGANATTTTQVPEPPSTTKEYFFVYGKVHKQGRQAYSPQMTLRRAIQLANGVTLDYEEHRVVILRQDPTTDKPRRIKDDLVAILSGKKEDIPILPDDVIIVSKKRSR